MPVRRRCAPAGPRPALVEKLTVEYYGADGPAAAARRLPGARGPAAARQAARPGVARAPSRRRSATATSGVNPSNDGVVIRLIFPPLTEERRKEYVKVVKHMAEDGRVAVRNMRRDARKDLEAAEKDGEISADELERAEKELEKITHDHVERDRRGARPQGARAARGLTSTPRCTRPASDDDKGEHR